MSNENSEQLPCDKCGATISRETTRCGACGVLVVTLGRAIAVVVVGLLLIPAGLWGVHLLRTSAGSLSTFAFFGILLLVASPILFLYTGAQLYRYRKRKLEV
jgi:hypothetical protein